MERVREFARLALRGVTTEQVFWGAARIVERTYREVGGHGKFWRRSASSQYNRKRIRVQAAVLADRKYIEETAAGWKASLYKFFRSRCEKG
jgi:hypothetical protein